MAKDMKTRKGRDNIYYPYTSPDLVIDSTGENQTVKNNNMKSEIQTIKENQIIFAIFPMNIPYKLLMLMILLSGAIKFRHLCLSSFYIRQK